MRKTLFATAAIAALALAGAASAQNATIGNNGFTQINNANQVGLVLLPNVSVGRVLTVDNIAAGNSASVNASADIDVRFDTPRAGGVLGELRQINNGDQLAVSVLATSTVDSLSSSTRAFGNATSLTAVNDDIRIGGNAIGQVNNGDQLAGTLVYNSSVPGTSDVLTAAVGNTFSATSGMIEAYSQGGQWSSAQTNNGAQVAGTVVVGSTLLGDSDVSSQALGNNAFFSANNGFTSHFGQTNNGAGQLALTGVSGSTFGSADIGSAALGNNLSITAGTVNQISPYQTNNAGQLSATYIGNSAFSGSLVAGAGAIGNNISVTTR